MQIVFHPQKQQAEKALHLAYFKAKCIDFQVEPPLFDPGKMLLKNFYYLLRPLFTPNLRNLCNT